MNPGYRNQVELLIQVLAFVAKERRFALHGGTAISLFLDDMPRLSVDIDLTYAPVEPRQVALDNIHEALVALAGAIERQLRGVKVLLPSGNKLAVQSSRAAIKVEVNTTMRGLLAEPRDYPLCAKAQALFDMEVEAPLAPPAQIYGGKLVAALDRQHARDLFDVRRLMTKGDPLKGAGKFGFMLALLSSERPFHEIIRPTLHDQRSVLQTQFTGMTDEPFPYPMFEETRRNLLAAIHAGLDEGDRAFLRAVAAGQTEWEGSPYQALQHFPGVQWMVQNILTLKRENPGKLRQQSKLLNDALAPEVG